MPMTVVWRRTTMPERPVFFWGTEIRRLRLAHSLSQRRLAHLAGVDRASLARFELGRTRGNLELVEKLVAVLGYEIDMVWTDLGQPRGYTPRPAPGRDPEPSGKLQRLPDLSTFR